MKHAQRYSGCPGLSHSDWGPHVSALAARRYVDGGGAPVGAALLLPGSVASGVLRSGSVKSESKGESRIVSASRKTILV